MKMGGRSCRPKIGDFFANIFSIVSEKSISAAIHQRALLDPRQYRPELGADPLDRVGGGLGVHRFE
jgi:hypothetical protein